LPHVFFGGVGIFFGEGVGEVDFAIASFEILVVDEGDVFDLGLEGGDDGFREDGGAVVFTFAIADDDLAITEVNVFDAQAETFHEAESASVEDFGHELGKPSHVVDNGEGFLLGEDGGKGFGFFGADEVGGEFDFLVENVAIQEDDGAEGLVLGGGGEAALGGEVGDEGLDFGDAHVFGMAFIVEEDVAANPVYVGLFGAVGVMLDANGVADLFEEFFGLGGRCAWGCGGWVLHIDL
jgi:hypothetical protein